MFTFFESKTSEPVALVEGGSLDGEILRIEKDPSSRGKPLHSKDRALRNGLFQKNDIVTMLGRQWFTRKGHGESKIRALAWAYQQMLAGRKKDLPRELEDAFEKVLDAIEEAVGKQAHLPGGATLTVLPNIQPYGKNRRECIYIAGPSGAGKSTWAGGYLKMYHKLFEDHPIYVFSTVEKDEALDSVPGIHRVRLNSEFAKHPFSCDQVVAGAKGACCVFDDISVIQDKAVRAAVYELESKVLELGRHTNLTILATEHIAADFRKTRTLLNETNALVFFPGAGGSHNIRRVLGPAYLGLNKKQVEKLFALKDQSRWVYISKTSPFYALYSTGAYILD